LIVALALYNAQQRGNDLQKRHNATEKRRNVTMWGRKCTMPTMVHCCRDSAVYHKQNLCSSKGVLHPCIPFHMPLQNFILDVKLIVVDKNSSTTRKCAKKNAGTRQSKCQKTDARASRGPA
jgi:hypothetical protein